MPDKLLNSGLIASWNQSNATPVVGNNYADQVALTWRCPLMKTKALQLVASNNNALQAEVTASFDGGNTFPLTLETDIAVASNTSVFKSYNNACSDIRVRFRPNVANQVGSLTVKYFGASY